MRGKRIGYTIMQELRVKLIDGREVLARIQIDVPNLCQDMIDRANISPRKRSQLKNGIVRVDLLGAVTPDAPPQFPAVTQPIGPNHDTRRKHVRTEPLGKARTEPLDPGTKSIRSLFRGL